MNIMEEIFEVRSCRPIEILANGFRQFWSLIMSGKQFLW